jgi:hypothetical protein
MDSVVHLPDVKTGLLYAVASDVTKLVETEESLNAADNFQYLIRQHDHLLPEKFEK